VHRRRIHSRALRREGDRSFSLSLCLFLSFFLTLFLFLSFSLFLSLSPFYIFLSSIQDEIVSNHSLSYGHDIYLGTSRVSSGGLSQRRDMNFDFRAERGVFYVSLLIFSQRYTRKTSRAAREPAMQPTAPPLAIIYVQFYNLRRRRRYNFILLIVHF